MSQRPSVTKSMSVVAKIGGSANDDDDDDVAYLRAHTYLILISDATIAAAGGGWLFDHLRNSDLSKKILLEGGGGGLEFPNQENFWGLGFYELPNCLSPPPKFLYSSELRFAGIFYSSLAISIPTPEF